MAVRAKELRQKEKKMQEQTTGDLTEKTPWEEQIKSIEEKLWEEVQKGEAKQAAADGP